MSSSNMNSKLYVVCIACVRDPQTFMRLAPLKIFHKFHHHPSRTSANRFDLTFNFECTFLNIIYYRPLVKVKVKAKVTLRLTVSQLVCLGVKPKSWTFDQNFPPPSKLLFCLFWAPSLTRGRVCHVSVFVIEVYHSLVYLQQYLHLN
jgi:hypothetical protein